MSSLSLSTTSRPSRSLQTSVFAGKMGNLCSKSSNKDDHFSQPGRVLGSSSQSQASSAPVPQKVISSTPGRTVGGSGTANDPKTAAAKAAEVGWLLCRFLLHILTNLTGTSGQSIAEWRQVVKSAAGTEEADTESGVEFGVSARTPVADSRCQFGGEEL